MGVFMCKKENKLVSYFKELFSKFTPFLIPFVSTILFMVFYILQYYDFWGILIHGDIKSFYYFLGVSIFLLIFVFAIVWLRVRSKAISFMDVVLIGIALFLLSYSIFLMKTIGFANWYVYLLTGGLFIITILLTVLKIASFSHEREASTVYTLTNLKTYTLSVVKKFSSLPIILLSIAIMVSFYYIMKHSLFINFSALEQINKPVYIGCICMLGIFVLYACIDSSRKKLCFLDLIILACALSLPAVWFQLIIFGAHTHNLAVCIAMTIAVIFFITMRVFNVDLLFEETSKNTYKAGNVKQGVIAFYKSLFGKFSFMSAFTLSTVIIFLILCAFTFGVLDISNPYYSIYLYYTVVGLLIFTALTFFICTIFTILTCKSYKILITDYVLTVLFLIVVICFLIAIIFFDPLELKLILAIGVAYCLTLTKTRIRHVKVYDGVEKK